MNLGRSKFGKGHGKNLTDVHRPLHGMNLTGRLNHTGLWNFTGLWNLSGLWNQTGLWNHTGQWNHTESIKSMEKPRGPKNHQKHENKGYGRRN